MSDEHFKSCYFREAEIIASAIIAAAADNVSQAYDMLEIYDYVISQLEERRLERWRKRRDRAAP
jgi:hypothetical protein